MRPALCKMLPSFSSPCRILVTRAFPLTLPTSRQLLSLLTSKELSLANWLGFYRGSDLVYVARVRNGFVPGSRRQVFEKIRHLVSPTKPFVNLPDTHKSRWGDELTAEMMKECVWLRPEAVARIEFLDWTAETDCGTHSLLDCARTRTREV